MNDHSCPLCGNPRLKRTEEKYTVTEPYASHPISFSCGIDRCENCEYEIFAEDHDTLFAEVEAKLKQQAMDNILDYFKSENYSFATMERILNLPQRTISKWKQHITKPSAAAYTLFTMLRTFPWLLEIAEAGYDFDASQRYFLKMIADKFINEMHFRDSMSEDDSANVVASPTPVYKP